MHICLDSSLTAQNPPHNPRSSLVIKAPCEWSAQGRYNLWNITWYAICSCISYIEPVCFSPSPLWKCSCVLINNTRKSAQRFSFCFFCQWTSSQPQFAMHQVCASCGPGHFLLTQIWLGSGYFEVCMGEMGALYGVCGLFQKLSLGSWIAC